jgi:hypothetical protein
MPKRGSWLDVQSQSTEKLPLPWFGVDHGAENFEEAIRLDEVQAFRISYEEQDGGIYHVIATLRGGAEFQMSMKTKEANLLVKRLKELEKARQKALKEFGASPMIGSPVDM